MEAAHPGRSARALRGGHRCHVRRRSISRCLTRRCGNGWCGRRQHVEPRADVRLTSLGVRLQALRGATTCDEDSKVEIDTKVSRMVKELFARNDLSNDDVVSMIFTVTPDLTAQFPATSARAALDLGDIPLIGAQEQAVPH